MATHGESLPELLDRAFRYALSLTHDRALAEDLLQEACLGVSRRGGPWQIGYLLAAVRNKYLDHCRRNATVKFEPLDEADAASCTAPASTMEIDDSLGDPMARALARLKPGERELLYLSAVEGFSTREIMRLTGRPRGTILSEIHRARLKLQQWLPRPAQRTSV
jgi:RNA polymerase sigma-70 factor, ECF subfamily